MKKFNARNVIASVGASLVVIGAVSAGYAGSAQSQIVLRSGESEARVAEAQRQEQRAREEAARKRAAEDAAIARQQADAQARSAQARATMDREAAAIRQKAKSQACYDSKGNVICATPQ